jgi:hypothetical protein
MNDAMLPAEAVALLERGEAEGMLPLSEVEELASRLELDEEQVGTFYQEAETRGLDVIDDIGRSADAPTGYANGDPPARRRTACSSSSTRSRATRC